MKDQYLGDINDYRKYGLLRCFADAGLRTMLCWMRTADDGGPDGRKRKYLEREGTSRHHDPELFDGLRRLVSQPGSAGVHDICTLGLVPGAVDYAELLEDSGSERDAYFEALHEVLEGDLAFFDPDNGLEIQSVRRGNRRSSKYVYWSELKRVYDAGLSLVVYQHLPRRPKHQVAAEMVREASRRMPDAEIRCLSAGHVLFLFAIRAEHASQARTAFDGIEQRWSTAIQSIGQLDQLGSPGAEPNTSISPPLGPLTALPMTGNEPFHYAGTPLEAAVLDLWRWSCSDLLSNAFRGVPRGTRARNHGRYAHRVGPIRPRDCGRDPRRCQVGGLHPDLAQGVAFDHLVRYQADSRLGPCNECMGLGDPAAG